MTLFGTGGKTSVTNMEQSTVVVKKQQKTYTQTLNGMKTNLFKPLQPTTSSSVTLIKGGY